MSRPQLDTDAFCASFEQLLLEFDEGVLTVAMGRDDAPSGMGQEIFAELGDLFDELSVRDDVRVVVLRGAGRKFAVGGNVKRMAEGPRPDNLARSSAISYVARMYRHMVVVDQPIIACLNGDAVGAGATLAFHCDILLAHEGVRIGDPHVLRGLVASVGPYVWPTHLPLSIVKEYLLTGDLMPATEAYRLGAINHLYPEAELAGAAHAFAKRLAAIAPQAVRMTKRLLNQDLARQLVNVLDSGVAHELITFGTEDHQEGARAFLERRPPEFRGR